MRNWNGGNPIDFFTRAPHASDKLQVMGDPVAGRRPTVALVGPGRAGTAIARAMWSANWKLASIAGSLPDSQSAAALAAELGTTHARTVLEAASDAEVVLIAVPDDQISEVARSLAQGSATGGIEANLFGHMSGALGCSALAPLSKAGKSVFGFHPVLPFAGGNQDSSALCGAPVAVAGDAGGIQFARELADAIGASAFDVADENRVLYHAACVLASNAMVALEGLAFEVASAAGVSDPRSVLIPLVRATVANLERQSAADALTGPVARGDLNTVRLHLDALDRSLPAASGVYRALSAEAAEIASGLDDKARREFAALLAKRHEDDAA